MIGFNTTISIAGFGPLRALQKTGPKDLNAAGAKQVHVGVVDHLRDFNKSHPNKLGGKRSNFYAKLAAATNWSADENQGKVVIADHRASITIRGGTIYPGKNASFVTGQPTKALTVPAHPDAYGERAQKFYHPKSISGPLGVMSPGKLTELIRFKNAKGGLLGMIVDREVVPSLKSGKYKRGTIQRILYWLMAKVKVPARPESIPSDPEIVQMARDGVADRVKRLLAAPDERSFEAWGS